MVLYLYSVVVGCSGAASIKEVIAVFTHVPSSYRHRWCSKSTASLSVAADDIENKCIIQCYPGEEEWSDHAVSHPCKYLPIAVTNVGVQRGDHGPSMQKSTQPLAVEGDLSPLPGEGDGGGKDHVS